MIATATLLGFSIFLAGIAALFRYNYNSKPYLPFILCIWMGCINEIISYSLWRNGYHTSINNNIYVLLEAVLYLLFFRNMDVFEKRKPLFHILLLSVIFLWVLENLVMDKIWTVSSGFRFYYSLIIVLLSITLLSRILFLDNQWLKKTQSYNIFTNPIFLICSGAILFFTFKLEIEIFWFYGLKHSSAFRTKIYNIMMYANLTTNLIYTLAILWMPPKFQFTTP